MPIVANQISNSNQREETNNVQTDFENGVSFREHRRGDAGGRGARAARVPIPDFSSNAVAWQQGNGAELNPVPGAPGPFTVDPAHPFVPNGRGPQPTFRIADLTTPNLKQWAKDVMKKDNDAPREDIVRPHTLTRVEGKSQFSLRFRGLIPRSTLASRPV